MAQQVKNLPASVGDTKQVDLLPRSGRSLENELTQIFLPGKFQRHRSLVSYSPWGQKESKTHI